MRVPLALLLAALAFFVAPKAMAAPSPITWCGTDAVATDRPDRLGGSQIHVVYAIPSDGVDRFSERASAIASDLNAVDLWWQREDPTRRPRFDLFAFPNCPTRLGQLDISNVRLPNNTAYYYDFGPRYSRIINDLRGLGHRKLNLVYYDGAVADQAFCGYGGDDAQLWLHSATGRCYDDLGQGRVAAKVAAHELIHALVGRARFPFPPFPNSCPGNPGHTCDDGADIISAAGVRGYEGPDLDQKRLDGGRNDYYAHSGGRPDVRHSPYLSRLDAPPADVTLKVIGGRIIAPAQRGDSNQQAQVMCETAAGCTTEWEHGTVLVLRATTSTPYSDFKGWHGVACEAGPSAPECRFTVRGPITATAVFSAPKRCVVPRVIGKMLAQATAALYRANCDFGTVRRVRSLRVRRGYVIGQSLRPGTVRPYGTWVNLVVSRGRR